MRNYKSFFFALLVINLQVARTNGMDNRQQDLIEHLQQVTITNKSQQKISVWQAVDWNFIHEQPQSVQQTNSTISLPYQLVMGFLFPHMTQPKHNCRSTGGIENEICTLSPEQSHNFNVMVCKKIGDGHYTVRTQAQIKIRNPKPSGPIWGPVICSYTLNTNANFLCVITENTEQKLLIQKQE